MIYVLLCDLSALFCSKRFQAIVDPAPELPQEEDSKHATIVSKSDPAKRQSTSESSSGASMTMFMNSAGEITMPNGDVFVKKKGSSLWNVLGCHGNGNPPNQNKCCFGPISKPTLHFDLAPSTPVAYGSFDVFDNAFNPV